MKKILLSLLLQCLFFNQISAESYENVYSIPLIYDNNPSYSVKIPKSINVSSNNTYFMYYVRGDIYADECLNIKFDEETYICSNDASIKLDVNQDKSIWSYDELTSEYVSYMCNVVHEDLRPGSYLGSLNVVISLIGGQ